MSAVKCQCPKCRMSIPVPQQLPAKVQCPGCKVGFTISPTGASANTAVGAGAPPMRAPALAGVQQAPSPAASPFATRAPSGLYRRRPRSNSGIWLLAGLGGILMVALVVLLFVVLGGNTSPNQQAGPKGPDTPGGVDRPPGIDLPPDGGKSPKGGSDARVAKAVKKGVEYLKQRLLQRAEKLYYFGSSDDPHVGAAALAGMTLIECDVPPDDPSVKTAIDLVHSRVGKITFTYSVALSILFLDRLTDNKKVSKLDKQKYKADIRRLALQLIGNQHIFGGWNYNTQLLTPREEKKLLNLIKSPSFKPGGFKPYPNNNVYRDNSISQFVILALWSARKHGLDVGKTLLHEETFYKKEQRSDGSWDYSRNNEYARDATTCAGLICLAIGHAIRDEMKEKKLGKEKDKQKTGKRLNLTEQDPKIKKGFHYLGSETPLGQGSKLADYVREQRKIATDKLESMYKEYYEKATEYYRIEESNPNDPKLDALAKKLNALKVKINDLDQNSTDLYNGMIFGADAWGDLYFLWSVERVAVIYGLDKINGVDWYRWGKEIILNQQKEDGSWQERFPGVPDTCFALLFLKRVNIVKDLTDKLRELLACLGIGDNPPPPPNSPALPVRRFA